ncbi:hypothetical protein lerEdw1_018005 [Lerista edwardsae]|nr:hypothetical protein lerEdw1_018005 [Lerista edwardsae]
MYICIVLQQVLLVSLVVVALGLGFGLGLRKPSPAQVSCRFRCHEKVSKGLTGCSCDDQCEKRQMCCWDYEAACVEPVRGWSCNKARCGESRVAQRFCSCSDDCLARGDCCTNYNSICKGEKSWVEDTCDSLNAAQCPKGFDRSPLILFSMDGFRAEYLETWSSLLPNVAKLKLYPGYYHQACSIAETCGTHSKYMRAAYPTKTFTNHYTIVTGLYPETHGIIDNNMYDVNLNQNFSLSSSTKSNPAWWSGQPVWHTAMYQGLKAGTYFWPGSDVEINGTFPNMYMLYNKSIVYEARVTQLLHWLDLPKSERPDFYTLYIEEPDTTGHSYGPLSGQTVSALQLADRTLGMLMEGLKQRNLHKCVNLIVLSDHGMDKTFCNQMEYMTDYFDKINFFMYDGPAPRIRARNIPQDFYTFDSEGIVKNLTCRKPDQHFKPYLTPNLPKRFHYVNNIRIDKVHLMVDRQWLAVRSRSYTFCGGGNHGYDNEFRSMEAIFLAHGPGFKEKTEVNAFENIEIYNLMCDLLQIKPAPNNGTHGSLNHLLRAPFYNPSPATEVSSPSPISFRASSSQDPSGCACNSTTQIETVIQRLNLSDEAKREAEASNLLYGRPKVLQKQNTYYLLHQSKYVSGYSKDIWMPLWSSYTVNKTMDDAPPLPPTAPDCLWTDVRIPVAQSQNCSDYKPDLNVTHGFLYPPNLNSSALEQHDALLTSNIVPMYKEFKNCALEYEAMWDYCTYNQQQVASGLWDYFHDTLLPKYTAERNGLNVISGPIFDYDSDGHFDPLDKITQ